MDKYLKINEDISLRYRKDIVNDAKAVILINHGFAEHIGRYEYVKDKLNEYGFSVYRYDLRGHGNTKSKKGHIDSYKSFISDCNSMVDLVIDENPDKKVFMLGHSMGGLVTCLYGIDYPNKISGQIFSGPAVGTLPPVEGFKGKALKLLSGIMPGKKIKNVVEDKICSDKQVVEDYKNDPLVLKEATSKFYREFLIEAVSYVDENISKYNYPCLILHGSGDVIVPIEIGKSLYENISSSDKEFISYDGLYHEILNEDKKDEILETINSWLIRHI